MTLDLHPATPEDAATIVALMDMASHGMARALWSVLAPPGTDVDAFAIARARRETGGFSYRNTRILSLEGQAAGMIMGWTLPPEPLPLADVPAIARPIAELENLAPRGTLYINALAVFPEFRRRGLARAMLARAGQGPQSLIAASPAPDHAPDVGTAATAALALYRSEGFVETARRPAVGDALWPSPPTHWLLLQRYCR